MRDFLRDCKWILLAVFGLIFLGSFLLYVGIQNFDNRRVDIRRFGAEARSKGLPATANPFRNDEGQRWLEGWMDGPGE